MDEPFAAIRIGMHVRERVSGPARGTTDATEVRPEWEREWSDAAAVDLAEARARRTHAFLAVLVVVAAAVAGLLPALFPLSPG